MSFFRLLNLLFRAGLVKLSDARNLNYYFIQVTNYNIFLHIMIYKRCAPFTIWVNSELKMEKNGAINNVCTSGCTITSKALFSDFNAL